MGRFGPFVQIGTKDDEEKPRFAGLRPGQKMDSINLQQAMELFKLPRTLGQTADGETITTNVGRFGPYVKYGSKYVSLKDHDPYEVTLEQALEVIRLKREADANRTINDFGPDGDGIQVLNGRYGPYVTNGKKNAKIPKDRDPKTLTLEECRVLIEQAPERGAGRFGRGRRGAAGKQAAAKQAGGALAAEATAAKGKRAATSKSAAKGGAKANGGAAAEAGANGNGTNGVHGAGAEKATAAKRPRPNTPASAGGGTSPTAAKKSAAAKKAPAKKAVSGKATTAGSATPVAPAAAKAKSSANRARGEK
jgi:DNA topoisomerase-1